MHGLSVTDMHEQRKGKHCKGKITTTNQRGQPDLEQTWVNKIFNTILYSEAWALNRKRKRETYVQSFIEVGH